MRRLLGALACCLTALPSWAQVGQIGGWPPNQPTLSTATVQVLTATTSAVVSGGSARTLSFSYDVSGVSSTTFQLSTPFPIAGTLQNFQFRVVGGVTGAQTWQGELVKNGVTNIVGCMVNASTNPCPQSIGGTVAAGDTVQLVSTPSGSPTSAILQVTVDFVPTTPGDTILPAGNPSAFSTSTAQATGPMSNFSPGAVGSRSTNLLPEAGTVDLLTVATNAPGTGSMQYSWGVDQNGSASTIVCPIVATATNCQDTTHSFTNADGDNIEYVGTPSNTPTNGSIGGFAVRWRSSVATNDFLFNATGLYTTDSPTATEFWTLGGGMNATEVNAQSLVNSLTMAKCEIKLPSAPGAGKSRAFTLDDNTTPTALTCTISGASATSCTASGPVSISTSHLLDISDVPSGSPSAVHPAISCVAHR